MKRKMQRIDKCITLNDAEKKVFEVFRSVLAHYKLTTTVRAAGGWVRDKLLGLESDDMDIAVYDFQLLFSRRRVGLGCAQSSVVSRGGV